MSRINDGRQYSNFAFYRSVYTDDENVLSTRHPPEVYSDGKRSNTDGKTYRPPTLEIIN